jgi:putative transposase
VLVITDGAPGLLGAVEQTFPAALRQRCLVHRVRNLLAKVPTGAQAEVKAAYWAIFDDIDQPPGQAAVEEATRRAEAFATRYERLYPSAVACLTSTLSELTTHLRFPAEHRQRIRTRTCSSAPSARPAGGPKSSAGSRASGPASRWSGRSWTARARAGGV